MRIKKNINYRIMLMTRCQILQTNIMRIVWQTVGRIANEILGVKGQLTIFSLILEPFSGQNDPLLTVYRYKN